MHTTVTRIKIFDDFIIILFFLIGKTNNSMQNGILVRLKKIQISHIYNVFLYLMLGVSGENELLVGQKMNSKG